MKQTERADFVPGWPHHKETAERVVLRVKSLHPVVLAAGGMKQSGVLR
jgi:hypothetical protein